MKASIQFSKYSFNDYDGVPLSRPRPFVPQNFELQHLIIAGQFGSDCVSDETYLSKYFERLQHFELVAPIKVKKNQDRSLQGVYIFSSPILKSISIQIHGCVFENPDS